MEEGGFEGKEETLGLGTKNVGDGEGGAVVETINMLHTPCAARCAVEPVILTLLPPTHANTENTSNYTERERERGSVCVRFTVFVWRVCDWRAHVLFSSRRGSHVPLWEPMVSTLNYGVTRGDDSTDQPP